VLFDQLQRRLQARGMTAEWADIRRDLAALSEVEVRDGDRRYLLRTPLQGVAGKVFQAAGIAIRPRVRPAPDVVPPASPVPANPRSDAISMPAL
jgi:hypothetical protein